MEDLWMMFRNGVGHFSRGCKPDKQNVCAVVYRYSIALGLVSYRRIDSGINTPPLVISPFFNFFLNNFKSVRLIRKPLIRQIFPLNKPF
jgi:hypothetical protein